MLTSCGLWRSSLAALACALLVGGLITAPARAGTAPGCDRTIAPGDSVQALADVLAPGQTGCLRGGTYLGNVTVARPGITLTASAGQTASIEGRLWIKQGADDVTVSRLRLNGVNAQLLPSPTVYGDRATFADDDVTNEHTAICFDIGGSAPDARSADTTVRNSRVHGCGLPGTNLQHGIYVFAADGTEIVDNVIDENADRGIQLYPDAQRSTIRGNVIDANGEGVLFSGAGAVASGGNLVEGNVIANSTIRTNVESWYEPGGALGSGNVVRGNCIGARSHGAYDARQGGFTLSGNTIAEPVYVDRASGDYRLADASPCRSLLTRPAGPSSGDASAGEIADPIAGALADAVALVAAPPPADAATPASRATTPSRATTKPARHARRAAAHKARRRHRARARRCTRRHGAKRRHRCTRRR